MTKHVVDTVAAMQDEAVPPTPARRPLCQCVTCAQGRAALLARLAPGVDLVARIADVLTEGTPAEQAQLKQLLGIE
jgi:hypothetical protein